MEWAKEEGAYVKIMDKHPQTYIQSYLKGTIDKNGVISFETKHYFKVSDVIMVDNHFVQVPHIVIDTFHDNSIIVRSLDSRWIIGGVDVYYIIREFSKGTV